MHTYAEVAPAFVEMAHAIVWCSVATVDRQGRPRSRVLHPYWHWDGNDLVGWIGTGPTPAKKSDLDHTPHVACSYWAPNHDTCAARCNATWCQDDETRVRIWDLFKHAPAPVGYDPAIVPSWKDGPTSDAFAVLRVEPFEVRVLPGSILFGQGGEVLQWRA